MYLPRVSGGEEDAEVRRDLGLVVIRDGRGVRDALKDRVRDDVGPVLHPGVRAGNLG